MILTGALVVGGLMLVLWLIHLPLRNAAIVDAGWAGGLAILGVLYAFLGEGFAMRRYVMGAMAAVWGLRLAIHLLTDRILGHPEEGRYQELRREWKTNISAKFLLFYESQAMLCVVLSAPFYLAARNTADGLSALEYSGMAVWAIGIGGEALADRQLAAFKADKANRGKTCRAGLWNYSRHPNYFFEWLIWIGFALFAIESPYGWAGLVSPALILYFLLRVTGIPATEAQALRSRGEEYRQYQETTSAFVPWPPKRSTAL